MNSCPSFTLWHFLAFVQCKNFASTILTSYIHVFQERIQLETARLYKLAGINPLAGLFQSQSFLWLTILVVHPYTPYMWVVAILIFWSDNLNIVRVQ